MVVFCCRSLLWVLLIVGLVIDFLNFMGVVIDDCVFVKYVVVIEWVKSIVGFDIFVGGIYDDSEGYFVCLIIIEGGDLMDEMFVIEYFGLILLVYVYLDAQYDKVVD